MDFFLFYVIQIKNTTLGDTGFRGLKDKHKQTGNISPYVTSNFIVSDTWVEQLDTKITHKYINFSFPTHASHGTYSNNRTKNNVESHTHIRFITG